MTGSIEQQAKDSKMSDARDNEARAASDLGSVYISDQ